jgi:ATP-binding cassette subfamily C exporter for protease/lipase
VGRCLQLLIANLLMLTPTLYMLQVFDRVLVSGSALTLAGLTLTALTVFLLLVMGFAEWVRSRLARARRRGASTPGAESRGSSTASFESRLRAASRAGRQPVQALGDLTSAAPVPVGQRALFAFFDLPWTVIYIGCAVS